MWTHPEVVIFRDARILGLSGVTKEGDSQIAGLASQGLIKPVGGRTLALDEAPTATGLITNRKIVGKTTNTAKRPYGSCRLHDVGSPGI